MPKDSHRLPVDTHLVAPLGQEDVEIRRLAEVGFDGAFTFEGAHDPFFPLVTAATAGTGLHLMTNVAIALPRSPLTLAYAAWDLQTLSGGNFRLGLGSQIKTHIERRYGSRWESPVGQMREWVEAIHAIFDAWQTGEKLDYHGTYTSHTLMTPFFNPGPNEYGPPPILLGGLGPKMTQMVAEVADGLLTHPFNSRRHLTERTLPAVDAGLAAAGRPARGSDGDTFQLILEAMICCGRTEEEMTAAEADTRARLAFYGSTPSYRPVLEAEGWEDLQPELNRLSKEGRWAEMGDLIDDTMLRTLAVCGTPAECAAGVRERFAEATRVALTMPQGAGPDLTAELLSLLRES
ncbi:MAG TPA: TIGR03617 family F420-dependent LLM class oxidoreductase [Mycobacteriales bacterium]|jgi:probable F420-dependent oxidoreductase|nr:TIGR03617 family F420-dependent LLM class oxidoreductase [Mycobacteriales bacterium]